MFYCQATSATKFSSLKMLEADGISNGAHPGWRGWDEVGLPRRSRGMRFLRLQV